MIGCFPDEPDRGKMQGKNWEAPRQSGLMGWVDPKVLDRLGSCRITYDSFRKIKEEK